LPNGQQAEELPFNGGAGDSSTFAYAAGMFSKSYRAL